MSCLCSVNDMCKAVPDDKTPVRGKVPQRDEYVVSDSSSLLEPAEQSVRRLARITPHGPDACIDSGTWRACWLFCLNIFLSVLFVWDDFISLDINIIFCFLL